MDDFDLIQAYVVRRAEDAFTALTARYINLVFSSALRQTGEAQTAEDVTQAVFLTLARKAESISRETILAAWLLRTTRFAAANARRLEQRRRHYEQQAMQSLVCPSESESAWQRIGPLLDDALDRLGDKDRDAVVMRFFEQNSLKHVAERLGISEDGAQKRVSRAIEKLRLFFARHGKTMSGAFLASTLAANSVQAAPVTLIGSISAVVGSQSIAIGSTVATLTKATASSLARARRLIIAVRAGSLAILLGLLIIVIVQANKSASDRRISAAVPNNALKEAQQPALDTQVPAAPLLAAVPVPQPERIELLLRVLDAESGAPVTNARLSLVSVGEFPRRITNVFHTDAQGLSLISYSPILVKSWSHRIEIFRDGYVPKYVSWSEFQQDRIEEIPKEYTVKADAAVEIGGLVLDDQDAPVPAMRIVFTVTGASPGASRSRERLTMMGNYHTEITDSSGRWRCDHVPRGFGIISYKLVHPEFQEKTYASDSPDSPRYVNVERIPEADFLAGRAVMRAQPGLTIAGKVTDESGSPVGGAKVTQSFDFTRPERSMVTDADGLFRFRNGQPRELSLTVQAAGLAPVVTSFVMNASVENLRFTLPPGHTLRGLVVDETGQPIADATVEAASPSADSRTFFEGHARTDRNGIFTWDSAPTRQEYAVYASGYESERRITLVADANAQRIQLKKMRTASVRILGQVLDADTKMPPSSVRVQIWETAVEHGAGLSTFTTRPEDAAADGRFRLKTNPGTISYVLEAQADGYWPERVTNKVTGVDGVQLNIELKKAPLCKGVVLTPAGQPAPGTRLVLCGPHEWALMDRPGKFQIGSPSSLVSVVADEKGRFQLPPKYAAEAVVAAGADGFAELPFAKLGPNTVITLQPWGRIEGTAQVGTQPMVGATIRLNKMAWQSSHVSLYVSSTTDSDGHFFFESVQPAEWKVEHEVNAGLERKLGLHTPAFSHGVPILVRPGETARVTLGGSGRALVGKAILPNSNATISWSEHVVALTLQVAAPGTPQLTGRKSFPSDEAFEAAVKLFAEQSRAYWSSEQGVACQRLQRQYRGLFAEDGSFHLDDVPPGDYTLTIRLAETPKEKSNLAKSHPIASLEKEISIPTGDGTAVNLGDLELVPAASTDH